MNTKTSLTKSLTLYFSKNPKLLFFPMLIIGVFIFVISTALKPQLDITKGNGATRFVDILTLNKTLIAPQAIGYGQVRPKHQWSAIAEVTGEIIFKTPLLSKGKFIAKGTELIRIDPLKYQLALAQAEADLNSHELQLAKLKQEQINLSRNLEIEKNRLSLTTQENVRLTKLNKQGLYSQSNLDDQSLQLLALERTVQEISQDLALFENEKSVAIAQINVATASVAEANRSLRKTVIVAPRDIKVAQVDIEQNEVVNVNQVMLIGHALEVMEIEAQVAIDDMHTLISSLTQCTDCRVVTVEILEEIQVSIKLRSANIKQSWQANVSRISETIDQTQATVGVILEVEQDLDHLKVGRPPLLNGMFIKATLTGGTSPQYAIPEKAIHTNRIYVMTEQNTLKIIPVDVLYRTPSHTVISGEIKTGDKLVLNDLLPAIEGMKLENVKQHQSSNTSEKGVN